jgi:hypothetical protein
MAAKCNRALRGVTYVSCWMLREDESDAMWKLYCGDHQGVAIRTTYAKLAVAASQPSMYVGKVTYVDFEKTLIPDGNIFYAAMHKRLAFVHESEVRVVKVLFQEMTTSFDDVEYRGCPPPGLQLDFDCSSLLDGIYVHPYAQEWFEKCVRAVVQRFRPELEPLLRWSCMRTMPLY